MEHLLRRISLKLCVVVLSCVAVTVANEELRNALTVGGFCCNKSGVYMVLMHLPCYSFQQEASTCMRAESEYSYKV